jgi:hypothetical protein
MITAPARVGTNAYGSCRNFYPIAGWHPIIHSFIMMVTSLTAH